MTPRPAGRGPEAREGATSGTEVPMDVHEAIATRRALRSLAPAQISDELIRDLAAHAGLAPSCANNQPWRFVFVAAPDRLEAMKSVFSAGNRWCHEASLMIAVVSRKEDDCVIRDRDYHLFDTGLAVAFLMLRATELGLIAHPVAGYSPDRTRDVLGIPAGFDIITIILVGRRAPEPNPTLSPEKLEAESRRPERLAFEEYAFLDRYGR
jgi:nitroreductase